MDQSNLGAFFDTALGACSPMRVVGQTALDHAVVITPSAPPIEEGGAWLLAYPILFPPSFLGKS